MINAEPVITRINLVSASIMENVSFENQKNIVEIVSATWRLKPLLLEGKFVVVGLLVGCLVGFTLFDGELGVWIASKSFKKRD